MIKTIKNSIKILACMLAFVSCDEYLDVQPEDKFIEDFVFSSEASVQNVINGIYMDMTISSLYGGDLTMTITDVLAQSYNTASSDHEYYDFAQYNYNQSSVKDVFNNIWTNMYVRIVNINKTIENLELNVANIPSERLNVLKGEMYGLRAMLHFDLFRLFGPVYSVNATTESIPYNISASTDIQPLLPASEFIQKVLEDLTMSVNLLNDDPVRTYGKISVPEQGDNSTGFEGTSFYRYRNLRLNYFAAKALQARVYLYAGNTTEAAAAAKVVINEATQWFNWVDINDVITPNNPDRIFSSEILFSLFNTNLYNRASSYFGTTVPDFDILAPLQGRLNQTFDNNENDFRFRTNWGNETKNYKVFQKFSEPTNDNVSYLYMQPLIRMSEMYFIAAETETDITIATDYLNMVKLNRGIPSLDANTIDKEEELTKAYKREFYGEGQLFYYYKRKNMSTINDGSQVTGTVQMSENTYVIPLPESETTYR
ncbi:RagB/SusD family nutrient uptake outer membrane protein [Bacteroidota bacterium]